MTIIERIVIHLSTHLVKLGVKIILLGLAVARSIGVEYEEIVLSIRLEPVEGEGTSDLSDQDES